VPFPLPRKARFPGSPAEDPDCLDSRSHRPGSKEYPGEEVKRSNRQATPAEYSTRSSGPRRVTRTTAGGSTIPVNHPKGSTAKPKAAPLKTTHPSTNTVSRKPLLSRSSVETGILKNLIAPLIRHRRAAATPAPRPPLYRRIGPAVSYSQSPHLAYGDHSGRLLPRFTRPRKCPLKDPSAGERRRTVCAHSDEGNEACQKGCGYADDTEQEQGVNHPGRLPCIGQGNPSAESHHQHHPE
jgi:hypothetical protein